MRDNIAAGNWKMNTTIAEGTALAAGLRKTHPKSCDKVILCVPYTHLSAVATELDGQGMISLAAQNLSSEESGAYTGEISARMLADTGAEYVLVGHSERRTLFNEDSSILSKKIDQALSHGLKVIYCLGEPLDIREANQHNAHVKAQLQDDLFHLSADQMQQVIVAYEPIWAIGTGKTATPDQAQEIHAYIRSIIQDKYDPNTASQTSILYGGSVKPANAKELFAKPDVDGGLVGGASLKVDSFSAICESFGS